MTKLFNIFNQRINFKQFPRRKLRKRFSLCRKHRLNQHNLALNIRYTFPNYNYFIFRENPKKRKGKATFSIENQDRRVWKISHHAFESIDRDGRNRRQIISKKKFFLFPRFTTFSEYLFAIIFPLGEWNSIYLLINFLCVSSHRLLGSNDQLGNRLSIYFSPVVTVFVKMKFIH